MIEVVQRPLPKSATKIGTVPLMFRKILKPLWVLLALLFLLEAWLWDLIAPPVARFVALIPWQRFKAWLTGRIAAMPAAWVLVLFVLPDAVLFPIKLGALWVAAQGQFAGHALIGMGVFVIAKIAGLAVTVFLFEVCRPKLMELAWFCRLYDWVLQARVWAGVQVAPIREEIRLIVARVKLALSPTRATVMRLIERIRTKMHHRGH